MDRVIVLLLCLVIISSVEGSNQTRSYTIKDGGMIIINCTTNETIINWMVNDINGSIPDVFSISDNNTLIIRNPRSSQTQGPFNVSCMVHNAVYKKFYLLLLKAPIILTDNLKKSIVTYEHSNISLPCETTGYPKPEIEWWFGDHVHNASQGILQDKVIVDVAASEIQITSYEVFNNGTLFIMNPLSKIHVPYENFTCVAKNIAGKDSRSHELFIGTLASYTFEITLDENVSKKLLRKIEDALWSLNPYDVNITKYVNSTRGSIGFEITWKAENQTQDVQTIADDVRQVLDGVVAVAKFVMNGEPGPPTDLKITDKTTSEITFTWKHPNYFIIDNYQILRKSGSSPWSNYELIDGSKTKFTLDGLDSDTNYLIKIYGVRNNENGDESTILQAETKASAPVAIIVAVVVIMVIIVVGLVLGALYYRRKPRERTIITFESNNPYEYSLPGILFSNIYTQAERTYCPTGDSGDSEEIDYFSWREIPREDLNMGKVLGSGEFGLVVKAIWSDEKNLTPVAVKTIKGNATETDQKELFKELKLMADVSMHPNIVNLVGACSNGGDLCIVVEFCEKGELLKFLRSPDNRAEVAANTFVSTLDVVDRLKIVYDVSKGMGHLEAKKIVHRDLAARNVLLGRNYAAKISDFGLSRDIYESGLYEKKTGGKLPVKWMAIESLQEATYTSKSDVWSFGVLFWEIESAGMVPYPGIFGRDLLHHLKNGFRLDPPTVTSPQIYEIMTSCWQDTPKVRPSFRELEAEIEEHLEKLTDYLPVLGEDITDNDEEAAYVNQNVEVDDENTMTTTC